MAAPSRTYKTSIGDFTGSTRQILPVQRGHLLQMPPLRLLRAPEIAWGLTPCIKTHLLMRPAH